MAVQRDVRVIVSVVDRFTGGMGSFRSAWLSVGKTALYAEAAIIAASAAAAKFSISMTKDIVGSAGEFRDAIYDVTAVAQSFGTTQEQVGDILDDMVVKFPLLGKEAGDAMQVIAQMGYGAEEKLRGMSDAAVTLSIATATDLNTSAKAAMSTMNSFGMGIEEADRIINLFAAASFTSAANVEKLRDAMKYAAPAAALTGQSVEQTTAVVAKFINRGLEASMAGTSFRMAMNKLMKETDAGRESLKKYGLTYADVNPEVKSLSEIIGAFGGQTIGAKDAVNIFGVRSQIMATIVNEGRQAFDEYTQSISGTTAAYDAMEQKLRKWSVVQNMVLGDLDVFKNTIGTDLLDAIVDYVGLDEHTGIRGVITALHDLEKAHGGIGGAMQSAFANITGQGASVFKDAFGDIEGLYKWLVGIAEALGKNLELISIYGGELFKAFVDGSTGAERLKFALNLVNTAMGSVMYAIAFMHDGFALLWNGVSGSIDFAQSLFWEFGRRIAQALRLAAKGFDLLPFVDLGERIKDFEKMIEEMGQKSLDAFDNEHYMTMWSDNVTRAMVKGKDAIDSLGNAAKKVSDETEDAGKRSMTWGQMLEDPVKAMQEIKDLTEAEKDLLAAITKELGLSVMEFEKARYGVQTLADGTEVAKYNILKLKPPPDLPVQLKKVKEDMSSLSEEAKKYGVTAEDMGKHKLRLEAAEFKNELKKADDASKHTHQEMMKNLDISAAMDKTKIENVTKVMTTAMETVQKSVGDVSDTYGDMFKALSNFKGSKSDKWRMQEDIEKQRKLQERLVNAQLDYTKAQTELIREQTKSVKRGDRIPIKVTVTGDTEGWLHGIMESLFKEIIVQAQAETFKAFGGQPAGTG